MQPLRREVGHQRSRPRVGQHPPHLPLEHRRLAAACPRPPASSSSSSGMLLHRKNDSRDASSRSLTRYGVSGASAGGIALDAEQELRADQHGRQRHLDAGVEVVLGRAPCDRARAVRRGRRRSPAAGRRGASASTGSASRASLLVVGRSPAATRRCGAGSACRPGPPRRTDRRSRPSRSPAGGADAGRIEVRLVRLARGFEQQRRLLRGTSRRRACGPARHRRPAPSGADRASCAWSPASPLRRFHREHLHALAVEQQLDLVRLAQPFDVLVAVARQADLDLVLAVLRERVVDDRAAARADGQAVDVLLLREVRRAPGRSRRPASGSDGRPRAG